MLRCASVVLAVAASVAIAQTPPDASTCLPWDATVEKAIHPSLTDLYKALSPLAVMSPGFGSCLRNGQEGWILLVQSIASNDDCNQTIKWLQAKPMSDIPFQHANRTQAQAMALAMHLLHLNDTQLLSTCTNTIPAVAACVMNKDVTVLKTASPCCASWIDSYTDPLPLSLFTSNLLKHVSNVFCSTQVVAGAKTSCGMTGVKAVIPSSVDMVDMLTRLADFLVAPNEQGCAAQEGLPFNDTAGSPRSPLFHNATPFSGCSASLDAFVQWIKSVPYLRLISTFDPSRLFANGSAMCVTGQKLLPYLELFLPQDKPAAMALITDFYANKCMHIANGFAASCKFRWPATEYYVASNWPYETTNSATATSAPSSVPAKSPASVPSSSAAAASALGWTASMIVLTAMM
ncbi:hypothetical protein DYB26_014094 [Aphanomyces astaci]|uniref:Uncharacterized protein n=1 Tax=Aphanomyces astaci TaxID=112090 RepID=A0A3R7C881_APHAT|nr:hypothetical protein DYB26_014094 [Aphanomyces astaci]